MYFGGNSREREISVLLLSLVDSIAFEDVILKRGL